MKKMKKTAAAALFTLALPVMAQAAEFQAPGTLGMGRAGVARTGDAYSTFINPAGLAFYEKAFSMRLGGGAGVAVTSSLADNADKIGKLKISNLNATYATAAEAADATAKAVQLVTILNDLKQNKGNAVVDVDLALGFQYRSYGLGIIGTTEVGASVGTVDTTNIAIGSTSSAGVTTTTSNISTLVSNMYPTLGGATNPTTITNAIIAANATPATSPYVRSSTQIFDTTQYNQIVTAFQTTGGVSPEIAQALTNKLEAELSKTGGTTGNVTNMSPAQLTTAITTAANMFDPTKSIDNNTSTILVSGLALVEVPLGYGYKFDLGKYGKLGVGGAAKVMQGSVYYQQLNIKKFKDSSDVITQAKDQHKESTQFGLDLGALWRLEDVKYVGPINVGLALKNLNSPQFDGPVGSDKIKVEPQARLGLGLDPLSWLSIAADIDLTKNKTVVAGRESQLVGGGLEAHFDRFYVLWLALRAGAYKNIADSGSKPVLTAGLSLGPKWLRLDINGAVATEKGTYDNKSVPLEAKVDFGLSTAFF